MDPSIDPAARRTFARSGVAVLETPGPVPVPLVPVQARIVRDGAVFAVPVGVGRPPTWRVVTNALALFALVLFLGLAMLALGPLAAGYRPVVVGSGSMEPALHVADVVVVQDPDATSVGVGTVVDATIGDGTRIHRVVEVVPGGFRTKGDANATADSEIVTAQDVRGVGVFLVPFVGLPRVWFDDGQWVQLGLLIAVFAGAARCSRAAWLRPAPRGGPTLLAREAER